MCRTKHYSRTCFISRRTILGLVRCADLDRLCKDEISDDGARPSGIQAFQKLATVDFGIANSSAVSFLVSPLSLQARTASILA